MRVLACVFVCEYVRYSWMFVVLLAGRVDSNLIRTSKAKGLVWPSSLSGYPSWKCSFCVIDTSLETIGAVWSPNLASGTSGAGRLGESNDHASRQPLTHI